MKIIVLKKRNAPTEAAAVTIPFFALMDCLTDLLALSDDFSLKKTLAKLSEYAPVTENFEVTLKNNSINYYCRQYAFEPMRLYRENMEYVFSFLCTDAAIPLKADSDAILDAEESAFMKIPLAGICPRGNESFTGSVQKAAEIIASLDLTLPDPQAAL